MKFFIYIMLVFAFLKADNYELGHGYKVSDKLYLGGYFSVDYSKGESLDKFRLDDVALLAYGNLSPKISYLLELEAAPFYVRDYENDISKTSTRFYYERAYVNYTYSEMLNFRIGKLITPIGYWNLEPINVLRDTSSNPLYSYKMFPKFVTGLDINGYIDEENTLKYHLFMQANDDIDEDYINIKNDLFVGLALEYELSFETSIGSSVGYYETKDIKKDVSFVQANAKYDSYPILLQTEWAYIDNKTLDTNNYQFGGYVQGMYNFNQKHAIVTRYEYFKDRELDTSNHIGVLGYSYRPMYSISIKAEYQINSNSDLSKSIISFSVLF